MTTTAQMNRVTWDPIRLARGVLLRRIVDPVVGRVLVQIGLMT